MKAVVAAFNQEKALVGAFSVITNLRMELFQAQVRHRARPQARPCLCCRYLAYFSCSAPNSRHSVGVAVAGEDPFGLYVDPLGVPLIFHNEVPHPASIQQR